MSHKYESMAGGFRRTTEKNIAMKFVVPPMPNDWPPVTPHFPDNYWVPNDLNFREPATLPINRRGTVFAPSIPQAPPPPIMQSRFQQEITNFPRRRLRGVPTRMTVPIFGEESEHSNIMFAPSLSPITRRFSRQQQTPNPWESASNLPSFPFYTPNREEVSMEMSIRLENELERVTEEIENLTQELEQSINNITHNQQAIDQAVFEERQIRDNPDIESEVKDMRAISTIGFINQANSRIAKEVDVRNIKTARLRSYYRLEKELVELLKKLPSPTVRPPPEHLYDEEGNYNYQPFSEEY